MIRLLRLSIQGAIAATVLGACILPSALAQKPKPSMVTGELLISVRHGMSQAAVAALAAKVNATIVRTFGSLDGLQTDTYHLRVNGALDEAKTAAAAVTLKTADPAVTYAGPNKLDYPVQAPTTTAVPTDPRFGEQWDKTFLRLPEAWTLEKGKSNVVIAVIDTGCDTSHPEFQGLGSRLLQGYNSFSKTNDPNPTEQLTGGHGTHVCGIACAATNNGIGVAGGAWENVKLLPINAVDPAIGAFPQTSVIEAIQFVERHQQANPGLKYVINMSLGGVRPNDAPDLADPENAAILDAAKKGIVFTIAAGNNGDVGNQPFGPAYMAQTHSNILCIASSNHLGQKSYYSEFRPYTTVAAPGGDFFAGRMILSTLPVNMGSYGLEQGTSMAAPNAAGVVALLLSVPTVSPADVKGILTSTARPQPGAVLPTPELGYGIIDAYKALLKVAVAVTLLEPQGTGGKASGNTITLPVETLRPAITIQVAQIAPDQLTITIDGGTPIPYLPAGQTPPVNSPYFTVENVTATVPDPNDSTKTIPAIYQAVVHNVELSPGRHTIDIKGVRPGTGGSSDVVVTDTRAVSIEPHVIPAGRSMISFPYYQYVDINGNVVADPHDPNSLNRITAQNYLGTNFQLARWIPDQERYVYYGSASQADNGASLTPLDVIPHLDGDPATPAFAKWPLGLGFWADVESAKPILTKGQPITDRALVIPLKADPNAGANGISWNMIGDPFPFDVPFNALLVDTPTGRIGIQEAADRGYILPNVYSYDGANGYTFQTLPAGSLRAWTGHWIGITSSVNLSLVVPPASAGRAAKIGTTRAAVGNGWLLQFGAHARNLNDTYNFIGVGSAAQDGYDRLDVPKPPAAGPFVSIGISHADWEKRSGLYAQDVRSSGASKTWTLVSNTDQPNTDVTVNWNTATLPKSVRLTLKDNATGQVYDMRSAASLTYNSGDSPAPRTFTVTYGQSLGRTLRIANLLVRNAGRGVGGSVIGFELTGDATYEVRILGSTGRTVANVATRAAAASGNVSVVWNGRDAAGKPVAAGTYLVQVRATTPDGDSVKAIQPFTVVR